MDTETLIKVLGAIAAFILALIALWQHIIKIVSVLTEFIKELLRRKSVRFRGHWKGNYPGDLHDEWSFTGELQLGKKEESGKSPVSGRINWTLVECSPKLGWFDKVGKSACEVVEGELRNGILTISGTKIIGEHQDFVELSIHSINCPSSGTSFTGNSRPKRGNKWSGPMCGQIGFSRRRFPLS